MPIMNDQELQEYRAAYYAQQEAPPAEVPPRDREPRSIGPVVPELRSLFFRKYSQHLIDRTFNIKQLKLSNEDANNWLVYDGALQLTYPQQGFHPRLPDTHIDERTIVVKLITIELTIPPFRSFTAGWGIYFGEDSGYNYAGCIGQCFKEPGMVALYTGLYEALSIIDESMLSRRIHQVIFMTDSAHLVSICTTFLPAWRELGYPVDSSSHSRILQAIDELIHDRFNLEDGIAVKFMLTTRDMVGDAVLLAERVLDIKEVGKSEMEEMDWETESETDPFEYNPPKRLRKSPYPSPEASSPELEMRSPPTTNSDSSDESSTDSDSSTDTSPPSSPKASDEASPAPAFGFYQVPPSYVEGEDIDPMLLDPPRLV